MNKIGMNFVEEEEASMETDVWDIGLGSDAMLIKCMKYFRKRIEWFHDFFTLR